MCTSATSIWSATRQARPCLVSVQERIEALSGKPPVQMKIKPPGHALEDESAVDQSDPGKFAKAKRAPPMPRFEAREAGFATLGLPRLAVMRRKKA